MRKRHAGITERPDASGRPRYLVRVRRGGTTLAATLPTLEAALAWRAQALAATDGRADLPERPRRPAAAVPHAPVTVDDAARRLCRGMVDGTVLSKRRRPYKPSVVRTYEISLRRDVLPRIGALPVQTLRRGDVKRLVQEIAAAQSADHARKALTALRVVLKLAEDYGDLDANPCAGVEVPVSETPERKPRVLTLAETDALVLAAEADDERFRRSFAAPFVTLAVGTGLRIGELLALRWGPDGLDLDAGIVRVRGSLDRHLDASGTYPVVATKSNRWREVPLPPSDAARLLRHRLATGRRDDGTLVFPDALGRPLAPHGLPRAVWRRVVAAAGIVDPLPRFHDLRHTFASHALAAGSSTHAVAELLGHSDASLVWERYGHALPGEVAAAGQTLDAWRDWHRIGTSTAADSPKSLQIAT